MKYKYIAIEREYGSGGTKIARAVAEQCGIPCYGREILNLVAAQQGIKVEDIDRYEESVTPSFLYTLYVLGRAQASSSDMLTKEGHIFVAEQTAIEQLAAQGRAVFVGHCAAEALKKHENVLHVFIGADSASRTARAMQDYQIPPEQVEATLRRFDKKRANYYAANTGKRWNDAHNYELVLDSGKLGLERCAAAITAVYQQENE